METDPEKVEVLKTWTIPSNLIELQSFLRFAGYYQRFIHGYTIIARALNELASGLSPLRKLNNKPRTIANSDYNNQREPFGHWWTPLHQEAFDNNKAKISSSLWICGLYTDASTTALETQLYQVQDGQSSFASHRRSKSERV